MKKMKKWMEMLGRSVPLVLLAAGVLSGEALAQAGQEGSPIRRQIDSASDFLGGIIGILFVAFVVGWVLKKRKGRSQGEK